MTSYQYGRGIFFVVGDDLLTKRFQLLVFYARLAEQLAIARDVLLEPLLVVASDGPFQTTHGESGGESGREGDGVVVAGRKREMTKIRTSSTPGLGRVRQGCSRPHCETLYRQVA